MSGEPHYLKWNLGTPEPFDGRIFCPQDKSERRIAAFFMTLALVFNDLKDLIWMHGYIKHKYGDDSGPGLAIKGQRDGMLAHLLRLIVGHLNELFELLGERNSDVLASRAYIACVNTLRDGNPRAWQVWEDLCEVARTKPSHKSLKPHSDFRNRVVRIRANGGFHYYDVEGLLPGYEEFLTEKQPAYIGLGNNLPSTRFYFADAAPSYLFRKLFPRDGDTKSAPLNQLEQIVNDVNLALAKIVEVYFTRAKDNFQDPGAARASEASD